MSNPDEGKIICGSSANYQGPITDSNLVPVEHFTYEEPSKFNESSVVATAISDIAYKVAKRGGKKVEPGQVQRETENWKGTVESRKQTAKGTYQATVRVRKVN